jgi:hypothetical protein
MTRQAMLFAGALLLAAHPAGAQGALDTAPPPPDALPYAMPMAVPANGCAWGGLVYSNGAVIQGRLPLATFFRCAGGGWQSFSSAEQATERSRPPQEPVESGSSLPPRR